MSREFGSYAGGYFHSQMDEAADDCLAGDYEITRLWGGFLDDFREVAYWIASAEAGDTGEDAPIDATREKLTALKARLAAIEEYANRQPS